MPMETAALLQGAYDLHTHCAPDVIPRAQDLLALAKDASEAGMAGVLVKDHTTSTVGRADALNRSYPDGPRFFSALVLNPPVGGLNPFAVEAALREGCDLIYFPTYAAREQIRVLGASAFAPAYPRPGKGYEGITVLDDKGTLKREVINILDLIAQHDGVLATGHLSPIEVLALVQAARQRGVQRVIVTHASHTVPNLTVAEQKEAVHHGAFIEHCLLGISKRQGSALSVEALRDQIRQVGAAHVILSSDLGQAANGPVVPGFARGLSRLRASGMSEDELRMTIVDHPRALLGERSEA